MSRRPATCRVALTVGAVLLALAATATTGVGIPPASAASGPSCNDPQNRGRTDPASGQSASARPVVLVHGWTGTPLAATAGKLRDTLGGAISTFQFDYGHYSSYWASSDHIAPCLAQYVAAVSAAHVKAHGDGRVVVVAHSMGGMAVRYAFSPKYTASPLTAAQVKAVITLSTPYTGSPLGHTFGAAFKELGSALVGNALPGLTSGDGGDCLAPHRGTQPLSERTCGDVPPYLPAGIDLTELGGDITVDRTFFGHVMYSLPLASDGIVPLASAQGYVFGGPDARVPSGLAHLASGSDACRVTTDAVSNVVTTAGLPLQLALDNTTLDEIGTDTYSPTTQALFLAATVVAPCSHTHITTDPTAMTAVVSAIRAELTAPVTITDLLVAPVPALRGNPAGTLAGGVLPTPTNGGNVSLERTGGGAPAFGDFTGDGIKDGAAVLDATSGVGGNDQYVELYTDRTRRLGQFDPTSADPNAYHAYVTKMVVRDGTVALAFTTDQIDGSRRSWTASLRWDGSRIVVSDLARVTAPVATDDAFGPVRLGMTPAQVTAATGASPDVSYNCTTFSYSVPGASGPAGALVHNDRGYPLPNDPDGVVMAIDTPAGTKTDRGVGDGSTIEQIRAAYADRNVAVQQTQAGQAVVVTTGNPDDAGNGNPGDLIGFAVADDGVTVGPPYVGGVPGYEYCSG